MGKYGLALDNLRSVELVTSEGKVLRASKNEEQDLFWAVRGGGGNFGVVTSFEYQLHPVGPTVTGGLIAHPFDQARDLLKFFREMHGFPTRGTDDRRRACACAGRVGHKAQRYGDLSLRLA